AIASYQQAGHQYGIAEAQHNLAITYRDKGLLDDAMEAADAAVALAERLANQRFKAQALAGRAEIRIAQGEAGLAVAEAKRALAVHRGLKDTLRETEDLRILAAALGMVGETEEALSSFNEVIERATEQQRPL